MKNASGKECYYYSQNIVGGDLMLHVTAREAAERAWAMTNGECGCLEGGSVEELEAAKEAIAEYE